MASKHRILLGNIEVTLFHADPWKELVREAWHSSRPNLDLEAIDPREVIETDAPIADIPGMVLAVKIPIFIREILCSMRDHIAWARTSRVDNLTEQWSISGTIGQSELEEVQRLFKMLRSAAAYGMRQDLYRQYLPLSYMTELTVRMSIRAVVKLRNFVLDLASKSLNGTHAASDLIFFANELDCALELVCPSLRELSFGKEDYLPLLSSFPGDRCIQTLSFIEVFATVPISLRAHIVRHRSIQFADNFRDVLQDPRMYAKSINDQMVMQLMAPVTVWERIAAQRNCWLAQTDLWNPILKMVNERLPAPGLSLPCSNAPCPYVEDNRQRNVGADPGVPCPREMRMNGSVTMPPFTEYLRRARRYVEDSGRDARFWNEEINMLEEED